jgi:hypothetical protein
MHWAGKVIVKIAPDSRKMMAHGQSHGSEVFTIADSGEHQQLGGMDCARGEHDLPMRLHNELADCGESFDRHRAPTIQDNAGGPRAGQYYQIRSSERRPQ